MQLISETALIFYVSEEEDLMALKTSQMDIYGGRLR